LSSLEFLPRYSQQESESEIMHKKFNMHIQHDTCMHGCARTHACTHTHTNRHHYFHHTSNISLMTNDSEGDTAPATAAAITPSTMKYHSGLFSASNCLMGTAGGNGSSSFCCWCLTRPSSRSRNVGFHGSSGAYKSNMTNKQA